MNGINIPSWMQSSVDPSQISTTIESLMRVVGGLVVLGGTLYGVDPILLQSTVGQFMANWVTAAPAVYIAWHSSEALFGLFRKGAVRAAVTPQQ